MNVIKFKTSLKCGGCVNAIRPHLNKIKGIQSWEVDLNTPDKVLTVTTNSELTLELQNLIASSFKDAGYKAELI
jgi:copper chaperone